MTNDGKARPLAVIVGERLKQFREEQGLRQADIATAAAACGLAWGRSSVAALESGTRNLSLEEVLLLPLVVSNAGGWDKPLIPEGVNILMNSRVHMPSEDFLLFARLLTTPVKQFASSRIVDPGELEELILGQESQGKESWDLDDLRIRAEWQAWKLFCQRVYPRIDFNAALSEAAAEVELNAKVADRLVAPDGAPADYKMVVVFSRGLWGRGVSAERDERAGDPDDYPSRRSLQSARGHITRELIQEIQHEILFRRPELQETFAPLRGIWNDAEALRKWIESARGGLKK